MNNKTSVNVEENSFFYIVMIIVSFILIGTLFYSIYSEARYRSRCETECKEYIVVYCSKNITVCRTDGGGLRALENTND